MPIQNCSSNQKPGFKWGNSGKCYVYTPNIISSKTRARNRARKQGIAEIISGFEFEIVEGRITSSNVKSYAYDSIKLELYITFNDNSTYRYDNITIQEFFEIRNGEASCITEGSNQYGSWYVGKTPSVGAAVYKYLVRANVPFQKVGALDFLFDEVKLVSYNDYPQAASDNAKRALKWVEENGWGSCGTPVGKIRANQLANRENISRDTIARMASFERQRQNKNTPYGEGCGKLMWDSWGGDEGIEWAQRKLKEIDNAKFKEGVPHYTKDGKLYEGPTHKDASGRLMTGAVHTADSEYLYHKDELAEVGERGAIVPSKKAPKSDTPNPKPEGEGTAKGDASTSRGAKVSERVEKILKDKSDDFNERYKEKLGYGVNIGMLKSVYQRGLGAFNVSHSPRVTSAEQWALARVNAFLYIIKNGRPENPKYDTDFDLLPKEHPKYIK